MLPGRAFSRRSCREVFRRSAGQKSRRVTTTIQVRPQNRTSRGKPPKQLRRSNERAFARRVSPTLHERTHHRRQVRGVKHIAHTNKLTQTHTPSSPVCVSVCVVFRNKRGTREKAASARSSVGKRNTRAHETSNRVKTHSHKHRVKTHLLCALNSCRGCTAGAVERWLPEAHAGCGSNSFRPHLSM